MICRYLNDAYFSDAANFGFAKGELANAFLHPFKVAGNNLGHRIVEIESVLVGERPTTVFIAHRENDLDRGCAVHLDPLATGMFSKICQLLCARHNIKCTTHTVNEAQQANSASRTTRFHGYRKWMNITAWKRFLLDVSSLCQFKRDDAISILIGFDTHSVRKFSREKQRDPQTRIFRLNRRTRLRRVNGLVIDQVDSISRVVDEILEDNYLQKLWTIRSINLFPIVEEYLRGLLINQIMEIQSVSEECRRLIEKERIDVFLTSTVTHFVDWAATWACRDMGVPVVTWQHGSYAVFAPFTQPIYYDVRPADYFLSFGEGVESLFRRDAEEHDTKMLTIGSAALESMSMARSDTRYQKQKKSAKKTIVVPLRGLDPVLRGDSYQKYSPGLYWTELTAVITVCANLPGLEFIFKLYPPNTIDDNPLEDYLRNFRISNISIRTAPGFSELVLRADAVIVDWPYTTLLESMVLDIPIFCYTKNWRGLRPLAEEMLQKRCFCISAADELEAKLLDFDRGTLEARSSNEFLRSFGLPDQEGEILPKVSEALSKIATEKKNIN